MKAVQTILMVVLAMAAGECEGWHLLYCCWFIEAVQ